MMRPMSTIDPDVLADLMVQADYKPGSQPSPELMRFAAAIVEKCASAAETHESPDAGEAGVAIRAAFGMA